MDDNGRTINLPNETPFEIYLNGTPSTGYIWEVASFNKSILKELDNPDFKPENDRDGAGGMYTFKFQTIAEGESILKLNYLCRSEPNEPPVKSFQIKVVCGTMGRILED